MEQLFDVNRGNRPTKAGFAEGLLEAGEKTPDTFCLGADITASVGCDLFAARFPDRFFSLGIAEQNCVGIAAGLALSGKIPVFTTYGVFAALRTTDQIRISVCYNNLHVIIGGAHAGVSVGPDGATHQALEDIGIMRSLPNMTVLSPCDATQTRKAMLAAVEQCNGPVYLRFGREAMPDFTDPERPFTIGQIEMLRPGEDITIAATGHLVWEALRAHDILAKQGVRARILNVHTVKPLDQNSIIQAASETGAILTAEEHQIHTGMGSAIAEVIVRNCPVPMDFIGIQDRFGESGKPAELMEKFGLTASYIVEKAKALINKKR